MKRGEEYSSFEYPEAQIVLLPPLNLDSYCNQYHEELVTFCSQVSCKANDFSANSAKSLLKRIPRPIILLSIARQESSSFQASRVRHLQGIAFFFNSKAISLGLCLLNSRLKFDVGDKRQPVKGCQLQR